MEVIDLQLHEPGAFLSWEGAGEAQRRDVLREVLLQMLDAVGVAGAVLYPTEDQRLGEELATAEPDRFASILTLIVRDPQKEPGVTTDASAPDVAERLAGAMARPGVAGVRFVSSAGRLEKLKVGGYDRALEACEEQGIPLVVLAPGVLDSVRIVAERYPGIQIILDHLGLPQPPMRTPDEPRWKALPDVLTLAAYPNVAIKMCGAPSLSQRAYPFADVWPRVARLLEAFGPDRLAWGSDIGRFRGHVGWREEYAVALDSYAGKHTYMESLAFFLYSDELTTGEKEMILGKTARRLLNWPAPAVGGHDAR